MRTYEARGKDVFEAMGWRARLRGEPRTAAPYCPQGRDVTLKMRRLRARLRFLWQSGWDAADAMLRTRVFKFGDVA